MYDIPLSDWLSGSVHSMSLRFLGYSLSLEKGMVIHLNLEFPLFKNAL